MSEKQDLSQALIDAMTIMVDYNNSRLTKDETVECEIIRKINVEKGEVYGYLGQNGAGKSRSRHRKLYP